jgi:hypothetical protein
MVRLSIRSRSRACYGPPAHLCTGLSVLNRDCERVAVRARVSGMCKSNAAGAVAESARPVQLLMYDACVVVCRAVRTGVSLTVPSGYTIRKGSIMPRGEHSR